MKIKASTDGVGKTLEVNRKADETDKDEVKAIRDLIRFLTDQLAQRAGLGVFE